MNCFRQWLAPKEHHVWKEIKRENLGSFLHMGNCPMDITSMYRIAIHEECLVTKEKRIREISSLWPE